MIKNLNEKHSITDENVLIEKRLLNVINKLLKITRKLMCLLLNFTWIHCEIYFGRGLISKFKVLYIIQLAQVKLLSNVLK